MADLKIFWKLIWPDNLSNVAAVFIAVLAASMGLFDYLEAKKLASLTLAVLALVAYSLIRDRYSRDRLITSMHALLNEKTAITAQRFFSKQTEERTILESASKSADLVQETGSLVTERYQDEIIRILNGGGRVRVIVCMPDEQAAKTLAHRNENLDHSNAILARLDNFHNQIKFLAKSAAASAENLEIRYTPYDPGYTMVLTNSETDFAERKGLVRLAGFRVPFSRKLDFAFDNKGSPIVIEAFSDEFRKLFVSSTKVVLLTAEPRYGKTTMFGELASVPGYAECCYHVISSRSADGLSFNASSSLSSNKSQPFAVRKSSASYQESDIRNYEIDERVWDAIAGEIDQARLERKIIFIDEIGQMQLQSPKFVKAIHELVDNRTSSLFATIGKENDILGELRQFKESSRSTLIYGSQENKLQVRSRLREELEGSIRLRNFMV